VTSTPLAQPPVTDGVVVARSRLSARAALDDLVTSLVPNGTLLSPAALGRLTVAIASRRDLWAGLAAEAGIDGTEGREGEARRHLELRKGLFFDIWLLAWQPSQETDWHDHGGSAGSFAVSSGALFEEFRGPGSRRLSRRELTAGAHTTFGPAHVHNLHHHGQGPALSIHAYSPPLVAMTYYELGPLGLTARETVGVDSPEGARTRGPRSARSTGGSLRGAAVADGSVESVRSRQDPVEFVMRRQDPVESVRSRQRPRSIRDLLDEARGGIDRVTPEVAWAEIRAGAALVDIRPPEQRLLEGEVPDAFLIGRNVLEWRLDPKSDASIPDLARYDRRIIVMCSEGYASSLAAATLRRLGLSLAADLDGGFQAWKAAGLPTRESA
jgi:rhodanese-related sulfurtransferase